MQALIETWFSWVHEWGYGGMVDRYPEKGLNGGDRMDWGAPSGTHRKSIWRPEHRGVISKFFCEGGLRRFSHR